MYKTSNVRPNNNKNNISTVVGVAVGVAVGVVIIVIKVSNKTPKLYTYQRPSPVQFSALTKRISFPAPISFSKSHQSRPNTGV